LPTLKSDRLLEALQKVDAQSAFIQWAVLAMLDGDIDEVERNVQRAAKLGPSGANQQFLFGLSNLAYARRALVVAKEVMKASVPDLSQLLRAALPVGVAVTAAKVIDEAQAAGQVLSPEANAAIDLARRISKSLYLAGRNEDELVAMLDVAGESMRARKLLWLNLMPQVIALSGDEGDDSAPGVHYLYHVAVSPRVAAAMTSEVAWRLVEQDIDRPGLSVAFVGSSAYALSA
jgi:hypothetical protein